VGARKPSPAAASPSAAATIAVPGTPSRGSSTCTVASTPIVAPIVSNAYSRASPRASSLATRRRAATNTGNDAPIAQVAGSKISVAANSDQSGEGVNPSCMLSQPPMRVSSHAEAIA
jgi:hypothetical protein